MPAERHADKRTYNVDKLATQVADSLIAGKGTGIRRDPKLGAVTSRDLETIQRITGESADQFNERISLRLREVEDKAINRIIEHLDADNFKTSELAFVMTSAHDKRTMTDGSRQINASSVNVLINYNGTGTKSALLDQLEGKIAKAVNEAAESFTSTPATIAVTDQSQKTG